MEVTVEKIVPRGLGLAFVDGATVFVPLSAAGDRLSVRVEQVKGGSVFAEIDSVIEPSTDRGTPPCKYFGVCGGCDFQQLPYEKQLGAKIEIVKDSLHRIGKLAVDEIPIIPSPKPLGYRTRAMWHADTVGKKIGYYKRSSHDVVDVDHCPILDPALDETLQRFRSDMEDTPYWSDKAVIEAAVGTDGGVSIYSADLPEAVTETAVEAAGNRYKFDARTFFQGNLSVIEQLIEAAVAGAAGEHALDLYCGAGLFSLPLARSFAKVTGVESNERAIGFARKNAENAGLGNLKFFSDGVGRFLHDREVGGTDFVLLDPPRAGPERNVMQKIIALKPREVSYVACDPSILARDLRRLLDGGYEIRSLVAIDLFPQTHHVEVVARLTRS